MQHRTALALSLTGTVAMLVSLTWFVASVFSIRDASDLHMPLVVVVAAALVTLAGLVWLEEIETDTSATTHPMTDPA